MDAGFDKVIVDVSNKLRTNEKYDRILDLIGPAALRDTFSHTAPEGIICVTGLLGGRWTLDDFDPLEDMPEDGYLTSFHSGNVNEKKMQEMQKAHEYLESSSSFGKVVVMSE